MRKVFEDIDKKKLIVLGGVLLFIIVILFGGALIYNKFLAKKSYSEVEESMKMAAIKYLDKNESQLPIDENESITVSDVELVNSGLMKSVNEQLKTKGYTCNGEVIVTNVNYNYRYTPILDCGDSYQTVKLVDYINNNENLVESGNGLYKLNNELVYRGDNVNNYLKLGGKVYRIVKIVNDSVVIILTDEAESFNWDDRYNIDEKEKVGINDYTISRMRDYLDKLYKGNSLLTDEAKLLVTSYDLKIGSRNSTDTDKTGNLESAVILENQYIGLLPVYDFLNASIDENCTTSTAKSCINYNYLARYKRNWWTGTAYSDDSYSVFRVSNGNLVLTDADKDSYLRPVLHLVDDTILISGNGSKESPYIVK